MTTIQTCSQLKQTFEQFKAIFDATIATFTERYGFIAIENPLCIEANLKNTTIRFQNIIMDFNFTIKIQNKQILIKCMQYVEDLNKSVDNILLKFTQSVEAADQEDVCSICLDSLNGSNEIRQLLPCKHCLHSECIVELIQNENDKNKNICPLCRVPFYTTEAHVRIIKNHKYK